MMDFKLPKLKYEYDALEPYINKATMVEHHTKHHQKYVNELNKLSESAPRAHGLHDMLGGLMTDEEKPGFHEKDRNILLNHGGGHYNHCLFWEYMSKDSSEEDISATLRERLEQDFGSIEGFKKAFKEKAATVFGSGWCWLVFDSSNIKDPKTFLATTKDQHNPIMDNANYVCLLGLDLWEHAYYLHYKSDRPTYIDKWWNVVNWKIVSDIFDEIAVAQKKLCITKNGHINFDANCESNNNDYL